MDVLDEVRGTSRCSLLLVEIAEINGTREYLQRAGFGSVEKHELAHEIQNNWYMV